jgi:hypothetical protein
MSRWSAFHAPIHSAAFVMDKQFCRRQMDHGVKTDIWSVLENYSSDRQEAGRRGYDRGDPSDVSGETRSRTHKPCDEAEFG